MDYFHKAKVRSAVGLTVNAGWFMDVVNAIGDCSDGDPTAARTLRDYLRRFRSIFDGVSSYDRCSGTKVDS
jgi:hypothetical protein